MSPEDRAPFDAMAADKNAEAGFLCIPRQKQKPTATKRPLTAWQVFVKVKMQELAKLERQPTN
jgi:hypothetical protein